jgi:hypothetical protein
MPNTAAPLLPPSPAIAGPVGLTGVRSPIEPGASRTDARIGLLGTLVIVAGLLLALSGAGTWAMVQTSLAGESITVAEDAARFGGEPVDGPLTAYYQADIIEHHALEASGGKTYAEARPRGPGPGHRHERQLPARQPVHQRRQLRHRRHGDGARPGLRPDRHDAAAARPPHPDHADRLTARL